MKSKESSISGNKKTHIEEFQILKDYGKQSVSGALPTPFSLPHCDPPAKHLQPAPAPAPAGDYGFSRNSTSSGSLPSPARIGLERVKSCSVTEEGKNVGLVVSGLCT